MSNTIWWLLVLFLVAMLIGWIHAWAVRGAWLEGLVYLVLAGVVYRVLWRS